MHIVAGQDNTIEDLDSVDSGWKSLVSCAASANVVIESGVLNTNLTGGRYEAASGDGVYNNGIGTTIEGGWVTNNSLAASGGTAGNCPGIEWGSSAVGGAIGEVHFGKTTGATQKYPIQFDAGSSGTATGNYFLAAGNVTIQNHVNNLAGSAVTFSCNGGSDVADCNTGGSIAFPQTVTGAVSGAVAYGSSTTTLSMSALLTQYALMTGGGSGAAPARWEVSEQRRPCCTATLPVSRASAP